MRVFLLASVAVVASIWALFRFYTRPRPPMVVPVPAATAEWAGDAGLIPAPEVEVVPK